MRDKPEPALNDAEWAKGEAVRREGAVFIPIRRRNDSLEIQADRNTSVSLKSPRALATIIAIAIDLLPAGDGRKITRETIAMLDNAVQALATWSMAAELPEDATEAKELADKLDVLRCALETYLPTVENS